MSHPSAQQPPPPPTTMTTTTSNATPAQIIFSILNACDNFPYSHPTTQQQQQQQQEYYILALPTHLPPQNQPPTQAPTQQIQDSTSYTTIGLIPPNLILGPNPLPWPQQFQINHSTRIITLPPSTTSSETEIFSSLLSTARTSGHFRVLDGWRNELYPILNLPYGGRLIEVERAGSCLLGMTTRGVHCNVFYWLDSDPDTTAATAATTASTPEGDDRGGSKGARRRRKDLRLIIPRRSATKSTYPSLLDNSIAGGISSQEMPGVALLREAQEEISLPRSLTRRAKAVGTVSYIHLRDALAGGETGLVMPEVQYCFDLAISERERREFVGVGCDGEVGEVLDMSVERVWWELAQGGFKPNCAVVLVDFLVRWGYIRAGRDGWMDDGDGDGGEVENEEEEVEEEEDDDDGAWEVSAEEYAEIVSRLHRKISFESVEERITRMSGIGENGG